MESEKVKEIKDKLKKEYFKLDKAYSDHLAYGGKADEQQEEEIYFLGDILTLINELERENERLNSELKRYKIDWLNSEKMHLQADIEDTEFELFCANNSLEKVRAENKTRKDRIAELEKGKTEQLKQFAERLKEELEEYRLENEYFIKDEPNGNLWQMNSSVFCIEVTQDGGLVDETFKEFINKGDDN